MDPSFDQRLHALTVQAEAYIEQIKNDDPLLANPPIFSNYSFARKKEEPSKNFLEPQNKTPAHVEPKKNFNGATPVPKEPLAEAQEPVTAAPASTFKQQIQKAPGFILHKPATSHKLPDEDIRKAFSKIAPHMLANRPIPSDEKARFIKNGWKEKHAIPLVPILASEEKTLSFLQNVAQAISLNFFPSRVLLLKDLEKQDMLSTLVDSTHVKLIISPDITLWNCKELMKHYQEIPQQKQRFLKNTPLLLLPDPSLYLKDPSLKRSLWNLLCHLLKPLQS